MNETTVMQTDLDRLAERVEKAAGLVQQLRTERDRFEQERDTLARKTEELEQKLHGNDPAAMVKELQTLRQEQRDWQTERRDVAVRIESLLKKLERLEG